MLKDQTQYISKIHLRLSTKKYEYHIKNLKLMNHLLENYPYAKYFVMLFLQLKMNGGKKKVSNFTFFWFSENQSEMTITKTHSWAEGDGETKSSSVAEHGREWGAFQQLHISTVHAGSWLFDHRLTDMTDRPLPSTAKTPQRKCSPLSLISWDGRFLLKHQRSHC